MIGVVRGLVEDLVIQVWGDLVKGQLCWVDLALEIEILKGLAEGHTGLVVQALENWGLEGLVQDWSVQSTPDLLIEDSSHYQSSH